MMRMEINRQDGGRTELLTFYLRSSARPKEYQQTEVNVKKQYLLRLLSQSKYVIDLLQIFYRNGKSHVCTTVDFNIGEF